MSEDELAVEAASSTIGEVGVRNLVKAGVLHAPWTEAVGVRFRSRAEAVLTTEASQWLESDITLMLSLLDGPAQLAVIQAFCVAAGEPYREGLSLVEGSDFRRWHSTAHADRRNIDLVIIDTDWNPVIAIEAKFEAACNGRTGYCSDKHAGWSNQLVCYLHGCAHPALDVSEGVKFLWLSPADEVGTVLSHVRGAVTAQNIRQYPRNAANLRKALERQTEAMAQWRTVSWASLYAALRQQVPAHADALIELLHPVVKRR
ncbi:hypothetical protein ACWGJ9_08570 [Curtobacterium citreum]